MADTTDIEWADATLNLWFGCTQLSPACDNCYAMRWGPRLGVAWNGPPKRAADSAFAKIAAFQRSAARFRTAHGRRRRVFINSLSDFFDNQAEQAWRDKACIEMAAAPDVVFILVTKRPQNVRKFVPKHWCVDGGWPENVWLLVTAENQHWYNRRVAELLAIPGPVIRGISMEPLLDNIHPDKSISYGELERRRWAELYLKRPIEHAYEFQWVIVGGESGKNARPMAADLERTMRLLGVGGRAVFAKQHSQADFPTSYKDLANFPQGYRVRRHPDEETAS